MFWILGADIIVPVPQVPAGEERGPGVLPNLVKENEMEEDEEEKKEADYNEEEMEGKKRGEEDSLVVEEVKMGKFFLIPFDTCLLPLQLMLQGSFHQEEIKQPHYRGTQTPNIMNYLVPPEAPDHLPLATLPCLPEQCNHCGKNFSRKSRVSKHMLMVQLLKQA